MHGRPVGKRVTADFFASHVAEHGIEACDYLLAVDVDMNPLPGYHFTNWDTGYGDFVCRPDYATARHIPWLEGTALVICDLTAEDGAPVEVSPRQILRRQLERASRARAAGLQRDRARVLPLPRLLRGGRREGLEGADAAHLDHRGLPAAADDTRGVRPAAHPQRDARRRASRSSSPRARPGGASTRSTSPTTKRSSRPTTTWCSRTGSRRSPLRKAAPRPSWPSGRWTTSGSSCHVHTSLWDAASGEPA